MWLGEKNEKKVEIEENSEKNGRPNQTEALLRRWEKRIQ